ncbi:MAG: flavin reductase family protein [Methanomicrobia archaeon]|nr:flavin reductase family protein [Methanomicrobia archaeon]
MKIEKKPYPALYPTPVCLVTCDENIITIAWIGTACYDPPMLCFALRSERFSHDLIEKSKEFVVNIPKREILKEVDFCGMVSGRNVDKFEKTKFTKIGARKVSSPLIKECPVNIECKLEKIVPLGTHDLFIGKIVSVNIDEDLIENGKINYKRAEPICYVKGEYWSLGEVIGRYGFSKREG